MRAGEDTRTRNLRRRTVDTTADLFDARAMNDVLRRAHGLALVLAIAAGCGGPTSPADDAATSDTGAVDAGACTDAACDDGLFCNGTEHCDRGACVAGTPPRCDDAIACTIDACSEAARACRASVPDQDHDGAGDAACLDTAGVALGTDCDDHDADRFPGNAERCDVLQHDEDCDLTTWGGRDADADSHEDRECCNGTACGDDCDDASPVAYPGATEVCNLVDDDCDAHVDEGTSVMGWLDADRDGRGDVAHPMSACGTAVGFSPYDDDCDDTSIVRSPITPELCDGIDNDCDDTIDEDPTAVDWYVDADGDGFGSASGDVVHACVPPGERSILGTDCDDGDPARSPAVAELCDGVDQDCNGIADYAIAPGDLEDDDHDGIADAACGAPRGMDCDDRDAASSPRSVESCDGRDNDCDTRIDEGVTSVVFYRDADGDGYGDGSSGLVIGCSPTTGYVRRGGDCDDADPARAPGSVEACNDRDDDCDAAVDEGDASSMCTAPHGAAACVSGACAVLGCDPGYGDCAVDPGCETTFATATSHCGRCGNVCAAGERCASGACVGSFDTTGLVAWLDASDPGIVVDVSGAIVSWPNRAGGADFVPFLTAPTLGPSASLAGPTAHFVSGGVRSTSAIFDTQTHTIFVAVLPTSISEEDLVGTDLYVGPDGEALMMLLGGGAVGHFWRAGGLGQPVSSVGAAAGVPTLVTQRADATSVSIYFQGVLRGSVSGPSAAPSLQSVFVGNRCDGCYAPGQYQGEVAEVLVYARALSATEIDDVHAYLRGRWGF
jgi:hypothetical protein